MADGLTRDPVSEQNDVEHAASPRAGGRHGSRPGNQRPHLVWPRLQMLFAEPASLLISRARRKLLQPLYRSRLYAATLGNRSSGELAALPTEIWPADERNGMALLHGEFRCGAELVRNPKPLVNAVGVSIAWQERKKETLMHPLLESEVPLGLLPQIQARLLARTLRGETEAYLPFIAR